MRVRLTRIDNVDLNLFEFDYDLTFMVFFLDAREKVYARYGGRDAVNPDRRQSLEGLHYTMNSVLEMQQRADKLFVPRLQEASKFIRDIPDAGRRGRCLHCHQVKQILNNDLQKTGKWERDLVWRYPLPENLGMELEVNRGNVVKQVKAGSPAALAGLAKGDVVQRLNNVPVHSFADAQFALDHAPRTGTIELVWQQGDTVQKSKLTLPEGWRKSDITWRPSMQRLVPAARLYGTDLSVAEKKALNLPVKQLAFRQKDFVPSQAQAAGVRAGDIILGVDDQPLEMEVDEFLRYVQRSYLVGDRLTINLLRDGTRLNLPMTLRR